MNEITENIIKVSQELFFKKGIRPVTLDEIAEQLKISKKTIYQHFENKDEIVFHIVKEHLHLHKKRIEEIINDSDNIIQEALEIVKCSSKMMEQINPLVFSDLKLFYPKAWEYFENFKKQFIIKTITKSLEKGIKQGLIRKDINVKLIAHLRLQQINLLFETDILQQFDITFNELQNQLTRQFLYGIATRKGIKVLDKIYEEK